MTTQTNTAAANSNSNQGKFQPIFVATVTPGDMEVRNGKNGEYLIAQGSTYATAKKPEARSATIMAFGKCFEAVNGKIEAGQPVDLAVQFDGGSLKVIGFPREEAPAAAEG